MSKYTLTMTASIALSGALCLLISIATLSATRQQQAPAAAIEVQMLGPQVGAQVPEFSLRDQRGETRTLSSLMGPKGAILVFFRSADW